MNRREEKSVMQSTSLLDHLRKMEQTNIREVRKEDLVDIADVEIDSSLPVEERVSNYLKQIKNPYCYLSHGVIVKISFAGQSKLEECMSRCIAME
ncbi:MAG: hypothetical protein PHY47_17580 [Lachnospiraceae bacterium]|nr:hypothetical protein [Lachnospiraceae bacterium]